MSYLFGLEKMHMAVLNLVGPGSMNCRLKNAINSHLIHMSVGEDIPQELGEEYSEIINQISRSEEFSEIHAEHCAQKIVGLHEKLIQFVH